MVQGAAAAVQSPMRCAREPAEVRQAWTAAATVFVGADQAALVAGLRLPSRRGVHVVGRSAEEVMGWSVPLEAAVLVLPDQVGFISTILDHGAGDDSGTLVRVLGGTGGVGASTLAAGLARVAARNGPAALVELAHCGGGIDLLFGAERVPGWRWDDLHAAAGHLGDLTPRLPQQVGVTLVSDGRRGFEPGVEAATAVLRSMLRTHPVVVVDAGRGEQAAGQYWAQTRSLLVVGGDVRSVLAARTLVDAQGWTDLDLVVRRGPGRGLAGAEVSAALGFEVLAEVGHHPGLARELAHGVPPALRAGTRFAKECARILAAVLS